MQKIWIITPACVGSAAWPCDPWLWLPLQGEEAEGDPGGRAAAGQEDEQLEDVAVQHRGGASQAASLRRVSPRRDQEAAGGAAGGFGSPASPGLVSSHSEEGTKRLDLLCNPSVAVAVVCS